MPLDKVAMDVIMVAVLEMKWDDDMHGRRCRFCDRAEYACECAGTERDDIEDTFDRRR